MTLRLLALALLLAPLAPSVAYAGDVEAAEHVRVSEEMRKLAARGNWSAVDAQFRALEALEAKGEPLSVKDFELGATAARQIGDIASALDRYRRGARAGGSPEIIAAIEDLSARFGPARVTVDPKYIGDRTLTPASVPFAPDERAAVAWAGQKLQEGSFDGLLPQGTYTVGGKTFAATPGGGAEAVVLAPDKSAPKEEFRLAWAGPRASVGVAFTQAGAAAPEALSGGLQPVAFGGMGARLGLGVDVGLAKNVGVLAQVGYHSLFSGGTDAALAGGEGSPTVGAVPGDSLHLGYGWLAASLRFGELAIAAGPQWGIGSAKVLGVDPACADGTCGDAGSLTTESAAGQRLSGALTAGGAAASIGYGFLPLGSLRGGLALEGGASSDGARWYPWGEVALTVAPAARRN